MTTLASMKTVAGAVLCGTGATAGIALFPALGASAIWISLAIIVLGFLVAAWPMPRRDQ